jgi:hypothetical protein
LSIGIGKIFFVFFDKIVISIHTKTAGLPRCFSPSVHKMQKWDILKLLSHISTVWSNTASRNDPPVSGRSSTSFSAAPNIINATHVISCLLARQQ